MPLFMEYHQFPSGVTEEEVKEAYVADLATQREFGIRYLQFWINLEQGFVFCLVEGPDCMSCERAHQIGNQITACNFLEVEEGMLNVILGNNISKGNHFAPTNLNITDQSKRVIVLISISDLVSNKFIKNNTIAQQATCQPKQLALELIAYHHGKLIDDNEGRSLIAVFDSSIEAIECALDVQEQFPLKIDSSTDEKWNIEFRISVNYEQFLKSSINSFECSLKNSKLFALITQPNSIIFSSNLRRDIYKLYSNKIMKNQRVLTFVEESFIKKIFEVLQSNLSSENFGVDTLTQHMNTSRSSLYRKMKAVLGFSPNQLITFYRLNIARDLLENKSLPIGEVAFKVGYSNPSYFAKLFKEEFGVLPSRFSVTT